MINYCNGQRNLGEHGLNHAKLQPYIYLGLPISQKSGMYDVLTFVLKNGYYYKASLKSNKYYIYINYASIPRRIFSHPLPPNLILD